jgi:hypothetical protein
MKKKYIRGILWVMASPFILLFLLGILIYLPPVQKYAVDKAAQYASDATGMHFSVGHIALRFPLNLVVDEVSARSEGLDTLLHVDRMQVKIQMLPLFRQQVEIDRIALNGATVHSNDLVNGLHLDGTLGEFAFNSHGVDLPAESALINRVTLKDADIMLCLNDTTEEDTTQTEMNWRIALQDIKLERVKFALYMPADSIGVHTSLQTASLSHGLIDLGQAAYSLRSLQIEDGTIRYDWAGEKDTATQLAALHPTVAGTSSGVSSGTSSAIQPADSLSADSLSTRAADAEDAAYPGLDTDHIVISQLNLQLDSLYYKDREMRAGVSKFTFRERSGLELVHTEGRLVSNEKVIRVPYLRMSTPDSYLEMQGAVDWDLIDGKAKEGLLFARFMADIAKPDVSKVLGDRSDDFVKNYPAEPLQLRAAIDGNQQDLKISLLNAELPGAFRFESSGEVTHWTDSILRGGSIAWLAEAGDLHFLNHMTGGFEIPQGTALNGEAKMNGQKYDLQADLIQPTSASTAVRADSLVIDSVAHVHPFTTLHAAQLCGSYDGGRDAYEAELTVNALNLNGYLPQDSLGTVTLHAKARGEGFDFYSPRTWLTAEAQLDRFAYGAYDLSGTELTATVKQNETNARFSLDNETLTGTMDFQGLLTRKQVDADLGVDVQRLDWLRLNLSEKEVVSTHQFTARLHSDWQKLWQLDAALENNQIITPKRTFRTKDFYAGFATSADSTSAYIKAGDLHLALDGRGYAEVLAQQADKLMSVLATQWEEKHIDHIEMREHLPEVCLKLTAGTDNPISNILAMQGIEYSHLFVDMDASPTEGLNGVAQLFGLRNDSIALDSITFDMKQDTARIQWMAGVKSGPKPRQEAFTLNLNGTVESNKATAMVEYLNAKGEQGVNVGVDAELRRRGIRLKVIPENPTLVYRPFTVNEKNYIFLHEKGRIRANLHMYDAEGTGLSFYSNREDTIAKQDLTLELQRIQLQEFRRILPYMPDMEGFLGASIHYIDNDEQLSFSGELSVDDFKYENTQLGSWEMSGVYLPDGSGKHYVDGSILRNGEQIMALNGSYQEHENEDGYLDADMDLEHFPLEALNPFVPENLVELTGDMDGCLVVKGKTTSPLVNGDLKLDSVAMFMPDLSARFHFDNEPVKVVDSKLLFSDFDIYTQGKNPFTINGTVDVSNLDRMTCDLRMKATNFELLNAPRTQRAMLYGKMYVDFNAFLTGPIDEMVMRGSMNVLGNTNFTYVLKDSPIEVTDRLGELVTFVNFADTVQAPVEDEVTISLKGVDVAMTMHIDQAVQCRVDLVSDGSNYLLLEGGGDLSFQYTPQGEMLLNGRYTLISGEMKYEIPVIPLRTFTIQNGSYLEWTGNVMNPTMNITATERVRATVASNDQSPRMVSFDVGVELTQTLENLGMNFILSAQDDASVQSDISAMSAEEQSKLAVTMLVTGMYMADGNQSGSFNMNNALNTYLQNEISNIAGKSVDISLGMETVDGGDDGGKRTDYNFQFAKRLWNNRFRIVIGGTVSTGNTANQNESFIDNVSIEYRLDTSGTRYVKLFHDKNYESVLEGEIVETGVGVVLRKKVAKLGELFIFKKKEED